MKKYINYKTELKNGRKVVTKTVGNSMEPLLYNRQCTVVIEPVEATLKKGDLPLYMRLDGAYVLHRIVKVGDKVVYTRGDNQIGLEKVPKEWILGIATEFTRKGKVIHRTDPEYRLYVMIWNAIYPVRYLMVRSKRLCRKIYHRIHKVKPGYDRNSSKKGNHIEEIDYEGYSRCLIEAIAGLLRDGENSDRIALHKPDDFSWKIMYQLAKYHGLTVIAYDAFRNELESMGADSDDEYHLISKWRSQREQLIAQGITQEYELKGILQAFAREGIRLIPLKGCIMKKLYPSPEYRQMADLDLLAEPGQAETAREIMTDLGYETEMYGKSHHDVYVRKPFMNVEIHRTIVPDNSPYSEYYQDIWDRITQDGLGIEDTYLYMIVHFAKHFFGSGSGIRSVLDIAVYLNHYYGEMNWQYVSDELRELDLTEFEKDARQLSWKWFNIGCPTNDYNPSIRIAGLDMESYLIRSGSYGNARQRIKNILYQMNNNEKYNRKTLLRYYLFRIFPDLDFMKRIYPILDKFPCLLPLCWGRRLIISALFRKRGILKEIIDLHSI